MKLPNYNKYKKYILPIIGFLTFSFVYNKYKTSQDDSEDIKNYKIVKQYLVNDSSLAQSKKPIIWIHMTYETNARWWPSFSSRNTENLNQPYQYLTLKTIIDKCGNDFNICLIDDETFKNILPGWIIDLSIVADPIRSKIRQLALAKVLNIFGGFMLPSSFLCFQNLMPLYNTMTENGKMFVGELITHNSTSKDITFFPDTKFMGCEKGCHTMSQYIQYLETTVSSDFTDESNFNGDYNKWCYEQVQNGIMNMIPASALGVKDINGKQVTLEMLMSNNFLNLHDQVQGLYIPADEILKRSAYQWFARLSAKQALASETTIGKYLLIAR